MSISLLHATWLRRILRTRSNLPILVSLPVLKLYLDNGDPALLNKLLDYFIVLSSETGRYAQARYLDRRSCASIAMATRASLCPAISCRTKAIAIMNGACFTACGEAANSD